MDGDHLQNIIFFYQQHLTSEKFYNTYQICNSFEMEAKHMKTSHLNSWECKPFTHGFMIFRLKDHMEIRVQIHESYISSLSSSNLEKSPHTNMIYLSFKMEAKYMKTGHSRAWECKPFTHGFLIFQLTHNMEMRVHIYK